MKLEEKKKYSKIGSKKMKKENEKKELKQIQ